MKFRKFPLAVKLGAAEVDKNDRHVAIGQLVENINTREDKKGELSRRYAFDTTNISSFERAPAGPWKEALPNGVMIDGADRAFIYDTDILAAYDRGAIARAATKVKALGNAVFFPQGTQSILSPNGDVWEFTIGKSTSGGAFPPQLDVIQYTVFDPTTGVTKLPPVTVALTANSEPCFALACDNNGVVFLWTVSNAAGTATIACRRWTTGYSGAPTATTYQSLVGNFNVTSIDAMKLASGSIIFGYLSSWDAGANIETKHGVSLLVTATGLPSGAPAPVNTVDTVATALSATNGGFSFVEASDTGATVDYVYRGRFISGATEERIRMAAVTLSTLACAFTTIVLIDDMGGGQGGCIAAFRDSGNTTIFTHGMLTAGTGGVPSGGGIEIHRHVWNGAALTSTGAWQRAATIASKPIKVGSTWYIASHFEERDLQGIAAPSGPASFNTNYPLQNGYFLHLTDTAATIVGRALYGNAGGAYANVASWGDSDGQPCPRPFLVDSTKIGFPAIADGTFQLDSVGNAYPHQGMPSLVIWDMAARFFCGASIAGRAVIPGPMAQIVGPEDKLTDVSPIHAPYQAIPVLSPAPSGGTVSTNYVCYRYAFIDGDGNEYQSSPSPAQLILFKDNGVAAVSWILRVRILQHFKSGTAYIKLYGSTDGGTNLLYQQTAPCFAAAGDYVSFTVSPQFWTASGEALETQGDGISNDPPPPCRLTGYWRKRVILGGTEDGRYRVSKEIEAGRGPEFNDTQGFDWPDVEGDDGAMCEMNWDTYALFREKGVGVVTGAGPDGAGNGQYIVQTITREYGSTNPSSVATGPGGCYFQNIDGRILLATPVGVDVSVGIGMYAYRDRVVTSAIHDSDRSLMRFYCSSGECLVLDYGNPTPEQPRGQWRLWNGADIGVAIGSFLDVAGNPVHVVSNGSLVIQRKLGTSLVAARKITLANIAANGQQAEFIVDTAWMSLRLVSGSGSWTFTLDHGGVTESHSAASPAGEVFFDANKRQRTRELKVTMQETGGTLEGHIVDGLALMLSLTGAIRKLNTTQRIA